LTLDAAASNAYASLEYDLTLTMEALQADEAAITGAWGLSAGALLDNLKTAVVA
jgi:hypothetical protein